MTLMIPRFRDGIMHMPVCEDQLISRTFLPKNNELFSEIVQPAVKEIQRGGETNAIPSSILDSSSSGIWRAVLGRSYTVKKGFDSMKKRPPPDNTSADQRVGVRSPLAACQTLCPVNGTHRGRVTPSHAVTLSAMLTSLNTQQDCVLASQLTFRYTNQGKRYLSLSA